MSMPGYINTALRKFNHPTPSKLQYAPFKSEPLYYGKNKVLPNEVLQSPTLDKKETQKVQQKVGTFLYYGRSVDPTILVALNEIGRQQSKPTMKTLKQLAHLMDYLYTYPNATLRFYSGTM